MDKWKVIDEINDYINQRIGGVGGNPHQTTYKQDFLRIFKHAATSQVELENDAIIDVINDRYPENIANSKYNAMLNDLMRSWREWSFFTKYYEIV